MRASSAGIKAVDVWDVLVTSIVKVGSVGLFIDAAISTGQQTPYQYSSALANTAIYKPANKTIVMVATLSGITAVNHFLMVHDPLYVAKVSFASDATFNGFYGSTYCDGTNVGYQNNVGTSQTLSLEGVSIA